MWNNVCGAPGTSKRVNRTVASFFSLFSGVLPSRGNVHGLIYLVASGTYYARDRFLLLLAWSVATGSKV